MKYTDMKDWAKDHWSLLAYVESRAVDHGGRLDHERIRGNPSTHPLLRNDAYQRNKGQWKPSYSTRLHGNKSLDGHDDWDCLDDLDNAGLVEIISLINGIVRMTDYGMMITAQLRKHKANGGKYQDFVPLQQEKEECQHEWSGNLLTKNYCTKCGTPEEEK